MIGWPPSSSGADHVMDIDVFVLPVNLISIGGLGTIAGTPDVVVVVLLPSMVICATRNW